MAGGLSRFEHWLGWLRNSFFYGVAVVLPFAVTLWLVVAIVGFIDRQVLPLIEPLPFAPVLRDEEKRVLYPGAGLVIAVLGLTTVGALTANIVGRRVVRAGEHLVNRVPLVRTVYGGAKQVLENFSKPQRQSFKEAVLLEFPQPGVWTIGFVTNEDIPEISALAGEPVVAVYVPQVPVPTTGFLQYLPRSRLRPLPFGPEEALKMCISLGMLRAGGAEQAERALSVQNRPVG